MLLELAIENFALIDRAHLQFGPGLNILTGETGAGKSIILGALNLILGAKASRDLIRKGADFARVEAHFSYPNDGSSPLVAHLTNLGIEPDPDGDLLIRRVIAQEQGDGKPGKNQILINGQLATRSALQTLAASLLDLCGQREHQVLLEARNHLLLLDQMAGDKGPLRDQMREACRRLEELFQIHEHHTTHRATRRERFQLLDFQIHEIETLAPQAGEEKSLGEELQKLAHAEELFASISQAAGMTEGEETSLLGGLHRVMQQVRKAKRLVPQDGALGQIDRLLEEGLIALQEAKRDLDLYLENLEINPERLQWVEERLRQLHDLARKHGRSIDEIVTHLEAMKRERESLAAGDEDLETVKKNGALALEEAKKVALALHQERLHLAAELSRRIQGELKDLGMPEARFKVDLPAPKFSASPFPIAPAAVPLSPLGGDEARFLFAPNVGEGFHPIDEIASGGELSRVMLALKRILSPKGFSGTFLFDEIDTGVSGMTGKLLGQKLKGLSEHHQVITITHLPQIACFANHHLRVTKESTAGRTMTQIESLGQAARIQELARMLGSEKKSFTEKDLAFAHARELLREFGPSSR